MSRSLRALAETRRRGESVRGAWERRRFVGQLPLERRLLLGAVSATKYTVILLAAGILVMAAEPALAAAATRHADPAHPPAAPVRSANTTVLAFGSGYAGGPYAAAVRRLQHRLDSIGDSPGPIDGRYGPRTERAVERFQTAHGLRVDGIAGPITQATLRTPASVFFPGAGYAGPGSNGVRGLQRQLRADGYSPGPIDGRYGPRTTNAVRRFQAAHGLHVDGVAGPRTFRKLKIVSAPSRPSTHPTTPKRRKTVSPPKPPADDPSEAVATERAPSRPAQGELVAGAARARGSDRARGTRGWRLAHRSTATRIDGSRAFPGRKACRGRAVRGREAFTGAGSEPARTRGHGGRGARLPSRGRAR